MRVFVTWHNRDLFHQLSERLTASTPVSATVRVIHRPLTGIILSTYANGMRLVLALASSGTGEKGATAEKRWSLNASTCINFDPPPPPRHVVNRETRGQFNASPPPSSPRYIGFSFYGLRGVPAPRELALCVCCFIVSFNIYLTLP